MIINDEKKEVVKQSNYLTELKDTQDMCSLLMKTPHYSKMKAEGIFAIIQTAKSLNINPIQALQGGLTIINGKVEMGARMMAALIRSQKHSITRDSKSDDTICILHGKRNDTKDCWTESFSIEEAKKAGIYRGVWITYPRDMLYARALSRLARQLFPDIIGNCYVEGEIKDDPNIIADKNYSEDVEIIQAPLDQRTKEEVEELESLLAEVPNYKTDIDSFLARKNILDYIDMPKEMYTKVLENAKQKIAELLNEEVVNG